MKKLIILSAIAMGAVFYTNNASAQISIHLGVNIPVHRVYVPAPRPVVVEEAPVYDDADYGDDYYYLPEVEAYYSVPNHCYYYNNGSAWISAAYLPGAYRDYNWRTAVRYEVRASRPYLRHDFYRSRWGGYAGDRNNWAHRFDRRYNGGGYAYQNHDNRGWGRDDHNRGNWNNRSNDDHNRGNWNNRPNQNDNRNRGNWGGQHSDNHNNGGRDRGNNEHFAQNRIGYGVRH
ncbi:hypothetical protein SNE25_14690 [Mucilaginibacter sabulilitoris]|uniref:DUF3300 domain-containing protein n=1 Tax=Mucilaginibacter sabulilitoris TaxID=1173583 RepID=A0ABZ0TY85_9SPHI|nr:hypothetical protein [Mucilaginibacter sabulilitoris]WPU96769.1 hypothetical protein SNE25_14690 [Mucilaginibacter sabulilitoris]